MSAAIFRVPKALAQFSERGVNTPLVLPPVDNPVETAVDMDVDNGCG